MVIYLYIFDYLSYIQTEVFSQNRINYKKQRLAVFS